MDGDDGDCRGVVGGVVVGVGGRRRLGRAPTANTGERFARAKPGKTAAAAAPDYMRRPRRTRHQCRIASGRVCARSLARRRPIRELFTAERVYIYETNTIYTYVRT